MNLFKAFLSQEDGLSTIEVSIILAVLIALAVVFRKQMTSLWNTVVEMISVDKIQEANLPLNSD